MERDDDLASAKVISTHMGVIQIGFPAGEQLANWPASPKTLASPRTPKTVVDSPSTPTVDDVPPPVPEKDYPYRPTTANSHATAANTSFPTPHTVASVPALPRAREEPSRLPSPISLRPMTRSTNRFSYVSTSMAKKRHIKFGKGRHSTTELIPQPSDDPADPLNWPRWRKELNLVSLLMMVGLVGGMKTVFVTTAGVMTEDYKVSYTAVAALTAVPLMLSSVTGMVCMIASKLVGKRPLYLTSFLLIFIGSMWNMTVHEKYAECMAARVFQGIGWGAFDTLVIGSIQDTYFEHERALRISIYNIFTIATTWGSPVIGGLASERAGSFTIQFGIINTFFLAAIPMLIFGAPETAFDRVRAVTPMGPEPHEPWLLPRAINKRNLLHDLEKLKPHLAMARPYAFSAPPVSSTILQAPRALVAPTTWLVFLISFIPYATLWSLAGTVALLVTPMPLRLGPTIIGQLMSGPWVLATLTVSVFCFLKRYNENFSQRKNVVTVAAGTAVFAVGTVVFGTYVYNAMTRGTQGTSRLVNPNAGAELSLPLLSFLVGMLAAGVYILDATTRPLIARSASFTSSSMPVAQRTVGDIHAGVVVLRNLAAGVFSLSLPTALATIAGLKSTLVGLSAAQAGLVVWIAAGWWFFDEYIWRADGRIMCLVDLSILKKQGSFFDDKD